MKTPAIGAAGRGLPIDKDEKMKTYCKYGNHYYDTAEIGTGYYYTDYDNGVPLDTPTCPDCFDAHILKYYPNGRMAEYIRGKAAYKLTPKPETTA